MNQILTNVTWSVQPGEHWIVFGPNGAGKTSLLNVVQGHLWPTTGKVEVMGGTLGDGVDVREMRKKIAVVSDALATMLSDSLTGLEILVTGMRAHLNIFNPPQTEEISQSVEMAAATGIEALLEKPFGVMSTGERQRLLIARSMMSEPEIIVLDEPCAGLDLAGREWVLGTLDRIIEHPNPPALILTTHHVEEISDAFTHAILLRAGAVSASGPIDKVFTSTALTALFDTPLKLSRHEGRWAARAVQG